MKNHFFGVIKEPKSLLNLPSFLEFSGLFYCSIIKVQFAVMLAFTAFSQRQLDYLIMHPTLCQLLFLINFYQFFNRFNVKKVERRNRDLNPGAAINDLLPFQGSPFSRLGISPSG
jgi:hypothetical protein